MTMRELDRFKVIQDVAEGKLKPWRAAERLELTTRQARRLVARLREHGPKGLVSGRYAKPSNNRLDAVIVDRALSIIRDRYADFGPTLACEKLWECHGIRLAKETVRKLIRRSATSRQRGRISNAMASRTWHRIEMAHIDARLRATGR